MFWNCVICSTRNYKRAKFDRESALCRGCESTWRARAVTLTIILGLGYVPSKVDNLKPDWSRIGLGISDDVQVASRLSTKFSYSNTFFDAFPNLDIRDVPSLAQNKFEFVSCSDVLEHIDIDLDKALLGLSSLLRPGGFAVLSVPVNHETATTEYYPGLESFCIEGAAVKWRNHKGQHFVDLRPEFHGGRGQNLAFRQFSNESFQEAVLRNGFKTISYGSSEPKLGVPWDISAGVYIARV